MGLSFDIGSTMFAGYDEDGNPVLQPDVWGEQESGTPPGEMHHASGFLGIPHEPDLDAEGKLDPTKASHNMYAWDGHEMHVWALNDTRLRKKLPKLKKGGSCQYGGKLARPAFSMFDGDTGSYQLYVPYAWSGTGHDATPGKAFTIGVNVRNGGAESLEIVHGEGMSITMLAGGKNSIVIKNKSGSTYLEINDDGVTLNGNLKVNGAIEYGGSPVTRPVLLAGFIPSVFMKGS